MKICRTMALICEMMKMMMMMVVMVAAVSEAAAVLPESKEIRKSPPPVEVVPLQLQPEVLVPAEHIRPLQSISISPWTYNHSRDEALYPPMLSQARCTLRGCRDLEGREDLDLESRPILHQVLVLRRVWGSSQGAPSNAMGIDNATYHYRLETREVAVGCTCVRHSFRVQH